MNEQLPNDTNPEDEKIAQKLSQVAEQTHTNPQFAAELEEKLRAMRQTKSGWFANTLKQFTPALRWVTLMILLAVVLSWSIKTLIPTPQPASNDTPVAPLVTTHTPTTLPNENPTPAIETGAYDWRRTKLHLSVPLPQSPVDAKLYVLQDQPPVTTELANALASQYGIQGKMYQIPGMLPDTTAFLVTDGKQRIYVHSAWNYDYYADYSAYNYMGSEDITIEQASVAIDTFMKAHGLDIPYQVERASLNPGMFYVMPLTPDGLTVRYDHNMPQRFEFTLDQNHQVTRVISYQIGFDPMEGTYDIRTAEEAFQQVLAQSDMIQNGVLESMRSTGSSETEFWSRSYPDNQTLTIYGLPLSYPAAEPGGAPFIAIGSFTAAGNSERIEDVDSSTYIEATGQFTVENGIRVFNVTSWKVTDLPETYLSGTLRREGDQVILTADNTNSEYVIVDAPSDLPMDIDIAQGDYLAMNGIIVNGAFEWTSIQYFPAGSQGGGGGGAGTGFYQLNLSGTPIPFPTPTLQPDSVQDTIEYVVKEGDTILAIAEAYGVSPEDIVQANTWLDGGVLMPGKTLTIPFRQPNVGTAEYIVQENDTLSSIALNFGITVEELKQANEITDDIVYLGQKLFIPGQQTDNPLVGRQFVQQRGTLIIGVYQQADGTSRSEFGFYSKQEDGSMLFAFLENVTYEALLPYHNRPLDIWGTVEYVDKNGTPVISVEKYEAPYPDLQFQVLKGTQQMTQLEGQQVALFTASDGTTYAQLQAISLPDITIVGPEGSEVLLETLAVPGETFGGYPTIHVFSAAMAVNPKDGQPNEITIEADRPIFFNEQGTPQNITSPSLTIEKVELVYYIPDPRYSNQNPTPGPHYLQPAWRFYGHYSDGSEVEFLVQALKQEFLLPELAPSRAPG
ncbi:MAG TPA: LysM peptidoglycan-binding domain-containing protein [Anaerolineales bacterium]|nr:LysM peptidoglycan-binding domain-containing protein [Anaerolineales bacterium]